MTVKQYIELLKYIEENNAWGLVMYDNHQKGRTCYKYVDTTFDTRDGTIPLITLRGGTQSENISFKVDTDQELQEVYEWLDRKREKKS